MVNAINPADVQPGEVWSVDPPEGRDGEWIGVRHAPSERESWRLCRTVNTGLFYASDSAVVLRHRLVPAPHDGRWTREDLPSVSEIIGTYTHWNTDPGPVVGHSLDAVVEHLNANGGVPVSRGDAALADHLGRQAEAIDELQLDLEAAEADRDRWRRAHEIVEAERDQARDERDEWKARAEAEEARTTPAVSRADVAEALSRCLNPEMWNVTFPSVVSEVCDLFGVEAGQATDPVEEKARELYRAATPDARWETVADEYRRIAAHVLGEEA